MRDKKNNTNFIKRLQDFDSQDILNPIEIKIEGNRRLRNLQKIT